MRTHPYLRAYMAGVAVPTFMLLVMMTAVAALRGGAPLGDAPLFEAIGRAIIFPMAVVPNLWGLWNMLHLAIGRKMKLPLGLHGALLPILIVPFGVTLANAFGIFNVQPLWVLPFAAVAMAAYYLAWKYAVGFLNAEVGIG